MENIMSAAIKPVSEPGAVATGSRIQLETETRLPNSRRIYVEGQQPGVRVPFREIDQNPTRNFKNELEENPPVRVYDTSGPYGDPSVRTDVREGLPQLRRDWIVSRGEKKKAASKIFPRCAVRPCAQRKARASRRCITPNKASSRPRWSSLRSER